MKQILQRVVCLLICAILICSCVGCSDHMEPVVTQSNTDPSSTVGTTESSTTAPNTTDPTTEPTVTDPAPTEQLGAESTTTNPPTTEPPASMPSITEPPDTEPPADGDISRIIEFAKTLVGRWYLSGYSDVYLDIVFNDYGDSYGPHINVEAVNFSFPDFGVSDQGDFHINDCAIYPHRYIEQHPEGVSWNGGIMVRLENWDGDLSTYRIQTKDSCVFIDSFKFVRTQGSKNEQTEFGNEEPSVTEPPVTEPPVTAPPVTEPSITEPPVTEPPVTEPPVTGPPSDVLIISNTRTISDQAIDTDVYITSTGVVTFTNVTVNGNVYCYGKLTVSGGSAHNLYAYYWDLGGITSSCKAWDGTHGLVKGAFRTCESVIIKDDALDYAFNKWGKR